MQVFVTVLCTLCALSVRALVRYVVRGVLADQGYRVSSEYCGTQAMRFGDIAIVLHRVAASAD